MTAPFKLQPNDADRYWQLRQFMLSDTPWAFASDHESDNTRDPASFVARLKAPFTEILAIESDSGELVASSGVYRRPRMKIQHRAEIWGVYVLPAHRKCGLGAAVMQAAIDEALSWPGVDSVALSISDRSDALGLYKSLGFTQWGHEPDCLRVDGKSYDEIHMLYQPNRGGNPGSM